METRVPVQTSVKLTAGALVIDSISMVTCMMSLGRTDCSLSWWGKGDSMLPTRGQTQTYSNRKPKWPLNVLRLQVAVTLCSQNGTFNCSPDKLTFKNCCTENLPQNQTFTPHVTVNYSGAIQNING